MAQSNDISEQLRAAVRTAHDERRALEVVGGGTKRFLGRTPSGQTLNVGAHTGVINYEPTELVITARAGTPLHELEATAAERGQMLGFEPPHFGERTTIGGTVAAGLSGPCRPYVGSVRDFVLGMRVVTGRGEILKFGGEVMKNVAGYDVSRLMTGAFGTLGIALEVSLKVLPIFEHRLTLVRPSTAEDALSTMDELGGHPLPVTASCFDGERLYIRLGGTRTGVQAAQRTVGGEALSSTDEFWESIRDQQHSFFADSRPLWRLSVPQTTPVLKLDGRWLWEWGGAQRWLKTDQTAENIRETVKKCGGHATLFRGGNRNGEVFQPLSPGLEKLHRKLKAAFDPHRILNPGRIYADL